MDHKCRFTLVIAALVLSVAAFSQTLPQGVQKVTSVEGITEYALPDGLHLLLFPDPSKPKVTVNMTYLIGSRQEGSGERGMAHQADPLGVRVSVTDGAGRPRRVPGLSGWLGAVAPARPML